MITKFEIYLKEGLTDKMTPKSDEDIILTLLNDKDLVSNISEYVSEISDPIIYILSTQDINNFEDYKIFDLRYDTDAYDVYELFERINKKSKEKVRGEIGDFIFVYFKDVDVFSVSDDGGEVEFMITTIDNLKDQLIKLSL